MTPEVRQSRLRRFTVPLDEQGSFESVRLWQKVSRAIEEDDQTAATEEKTALEEAQRASAKERKAIGIEWIPNHFELVSLSWKKLLLVPKNSPHLFVFPPNARTR